MLTARGLQRSAPPKVRDDRRPFWGLDPILIGATLTLSAFGLLMVAVASGGTQPALTSAVQHQLLFDVIGIGLGAAFTFVDYSRLDVVGLLLYAGSVVLLLAVLSPLGSVVNGARSWFTVGSFQLQPAEFIKLALILVLATVAGRARTRTDLADTRRFGICLALLALPAALIMLQPDLGEVLVLGAITITVVVVAGAPVRFLAVLGLIAFFGAVAVFQLGVVKHYQVDRLTYFINPETNGGTGAGYNAHQAEVALGSGGLTGTGLFHGTQTRLHFVPEQQTDFIFSVVGEELGLVGCLAMLALDALIVWRLWRSAVLARDQVGTLLCVGTLAFFLFHLFENAGMNMGIMPITGIPLPLVSYGGSATIVMMSAIGLALNVHRHRFR